jgi:hypothetical protein
MKKLGLRSTELYNGEYRKTKKRLDKTVKELETIIQKLRDEQLESFDFTTKLKRATKKGRNNA